MKQFGCLLFALALAACGSEDTTGPGGATGGESPDADAHGGHHLPDVSDGGADAPVPDGADATPDGAGTGGDVLDVVDPDDTTDPPDDGPPPVLCEPGEPCNDGNPCTTGDTCGAGNVCQGTAYTCDDGRECTVDTCLGNGDCAFAVAPGRCLIANVCYQPDDAHLQNDCVVCDPAGSATEWSLAAAGTACGDDDACLTAGECLDGQCDGGLLGCDDGNACTDDVCIPGSGCQHVPNYDPCEDGDACTIGDACFFGKCKTGIETLICNDEEPCTNDTCGPEGCVFLPRTGPCEDGTACTKGDTCAGGECIPGAPVVCDDGNLCTEEACDPYIGCLATPVDSACCDGGVSLCDDGDPCTTDACDEDLGECIYLANEAPCDDGDACTGPDACDGLACGGPPLNCDDGNACTADSCVAALGGCQHQNVPGACNDGNACTKDDKCIGGTCTGGPLVCNDNNPCTADSCDPLTGCKNVVKTGPCDDGNACTTNTVCSASGCKGTPVNCNDGNPCTNDACHPTAGCQHQPVAGACDDQLACSTGDTCVGGQCSANTSECGCIPTWSDVVSKFTKFNIGPDGKPGNGLDVDLDPSTCAPAGKCSDGIDNQLAAFAGLANGPLDEQVADGELVLLFDHLDFKSTGQTYQLNFYPGDTPSGSVCDVQSEVCNYEIKSDGFDPETCEPLIAFDNAKIVGGKTLKAGGNGYTFPFEIPLSGAVLTVVVQRARIEATVTIKNGKVTAMTGVLAGAIAKQTFLDAIDALGPGDLPEGTSKEQIKGLINILIQNDPDTDGNGSKDAASIGLSFQAIAGTIIGAEL